MRSRSGRLFSSSRGSPRANRVPRSYHQDLQANPIFEISGRQGLDPPSRPGAKGGPVGIAKEMRDQ